MTLDEIKQAVEYMRGAGVLRFRIGDTEIHFDPRASQIPRATGTTINPKQFTVDPPEVSSVLDANQVVPDAVADLLDVNNT